MAQALHKVGRVKCQPFLKCSNHWKWALNNFQGKRSYCVGSIFLGLALSTRVKIVHCPNAVKFLLFMRVETAAYNCN